MAPSNSVVKFMVSKINLAKHDYLEIRDGRDESDVMLKNLSSTETESSNQMYKSTGPFLWIKFKSDKQKVSEGFRVYVEFESRPISK